EEKDPPSEELEHPLIERIEVAATDREAPEKGAIVGEGDHHRIRPVNAHEDRGVAGKSSGSWPKHIDPDAGGCSSVLMVGMLGILGRNPHVLKRPQRITRAPPDSCGSVPLADARPPVHPPIQTQIKPKSDLSFILPSEWAFERTTP